MSRLSSSSNLSNEEAFDYLFKIVVVGDCGIGKTSLVQRFKTGGFTEKYTNTIGVDFAMKTVVIEGKQVKVCSSRNYFVFLVLFILYYHMSVTVTNLGHSWSGALPNNNTELLQVIIIM